MRVLVWLETEDDGSEDVRLRRMLKGAKRAYRFRADAVRPLPDPAELARAAVQVRSVANLELCEVRLSGPDGDSVMTTASPGRAETIARTIRGIVEAILADLLKVVTGQ